MKIYKDLIAPEKLAFLHEDLTCSLRNTSRPTSPRQSPYCQRYDKIISVSCQQLIMGALVILPLLALGVSAFFSFTRPDKA